MTEHEQLKFICNKIGYKWITEIEIEYIKWTISLNVREIIFTQEFMKNFLQKLDTMEKYRSDTKLEIEQEVSYWLINNLDNPTNCLYDFIK